ncbi:unnamed protein product [Fraxinus pennsylvanica]|uniref:Myb/SANT-like domain-containing protein n=1 Tax=Fraxinus pennsylvanica TaxID=56036 RepID=A0AAD1ZU71_9LAMI|nr:unnamed protein product [Fraxinus pennsylvanica]
MAQNRRSSMGPFPVPRPTNPGDGNQVDLGRKQVDANAKTRHVRWSDEMDGLFITSLVEQVLDGHKRTDNGFTAFQVSKAMERVSNGCGVIVSDKNVRARLKTLKKEHNEVRQLLNMSGFGLDPETGCIVADQVAWDEFIKVILGAGGNNTGSEGLFGGDALKEESWDVGKSQGRKKKDGDSEEEIGA